MAMALVGGLTVSVAALAQAGPSAAEALANEAARLRALDVRLDHTRLPDGAAK